MNKNKYGIKIVISLFLLGTLLALPGCGTVIDTSDKLKVIEVNLSHL